MDEPAVSQRIDKWLWAARFFKTRTQAGDAVDGGKVRCNGQPCKPSRSVKIGDWLEITVGQLQWSVCVLGINAQRRPAEEARLLYEESGESRQRREQVLEIRDQLYALAEIIYEKWQQDKKAGKLPVNRQVPDSSRGSMPSGN